MKKQKWTVGILLTSALFLSSCSLINHQKVSQLSPQQKICTQLRQQIIYQNNGAGPNSQSTPTQQAQMMRQYQMYNCGALEQGAAIQ